MADYIDSGADRRELPVTRNIPWIIYVGADTIYRHVKDFELRIKDFSLLCGSAASALSLLLTLVTTKEFTEAFRVPASVWHAIVVIGFVICTLISIWKAINLWRNRKKLDIDYVVNRIAGVSQSSKQEVSSVSLQTFTSGLDEANRGESFELDLGSITDK